MIGQIFGKIFGSQSIVNKAAEGIYNGVDALVYTDEEKADKFAKFLKLYEPFKIAQRWLAIIYSTPYALAWFVTFVASFFMEVTEQLALLQGDIGTINLLILGFYFAGGSFESLAKRRSKN
jgi:hypothetical protein